MGRTTARKLIFQGRGLDGRVPGEMGAAARARVSRLLIAVSTRSMTTSPCGLARALVERRVLRPHPGRRAGSKRGGPRCAAMRADAEVLSGGCACGAVRFVLRAAPLRVGLCHCMTCRKAHGAASNPFAVFKAEALTVTGDLRSWFSSPGYDRQFCGACGSRVIARHGDEVEVSLGSLDEPGRLDPQYECWIVRREPWLSPLAGPQYARARGE